MTADPAALDAFLSSALDPAPAEIAAVLTAEDAEEIRELTDLALAEAVIAIVWSQHWSGHA